MLGAAMMLRPSDAIFPEAFSDDFSTAASGWTEDGDWDRTGGSVASRVTTGSPTVHDLLYRNGATHADGWAECIPKDNEIGPAVRIGGGGGGSARGYMACQTSGGVAIYRMNSDGSRTQLVLNATASIDLSTDVLRITMQGILVYFWINGAPPGGVNAAFDTTFGSGHWGVAVNAAVGTLDVDDYAEGY